ncbi:Holliday junction branch migration protein RuvA [Anaerolentibacter hominis]|uniref:Holliday junction branch migration protein RuvA n=1 Tax=Anaerolentibacter hominis TaxID=3079009 RepID=UPI0031B8A16B
MIAYIKGELAEVTDSSIVVESGGMGFYIFVPASVAEDLPPAGSEVKIYTYFHVREDIMQLYGFLCQEDKEIFELLLTVNGIGPKAALAILSTVRPDDLRFAILSDDVKTISSAPGVGKKTAQKLILELKDKFKLEDAFERKSERTAADGEPGMQAGAGQIRNEVSEALIALGYSPANAMRAVRSVEITDGMDVEDVLKLSLKNI